MRDCSKSFVFETEVPPYQKEAIEWLRGYRNTDVLQDLLKRLRFSKEEIAAYRISWAVWLKPKEQTRKKIHNAIH